MMWMLLEWSEDQDIYPTYKIIRKKYVLEQDCAQIGKYIRFRDKRSKKKRRAKIVMCSENRKTLKEHKKKLVRRGRKVKAIMSKCMQKCRKQMHVLQKRKMTPEPEPELSDCLPGPSKICMLRFPRIPNMPTSPSSSSSNQSVTSPSMPSSSITSITIHNTSSSSTTSPSSDENKRKTEIRMPAPLIERSRTEKSRIVRSRSRSPHASRNTSESRRIRHSHRRMHLIRSRSLVCSTPKSKKPPRIVYDNTTQTDPTSTTTDKPTVKMFMLFVGQMHNQFVKLLGKIEDLKENRNDNGSQQQNELDSTDNSESDISDSEDLPHQDLIDILKGLNVNVQVVDTNGRHSNENTRHSNETVTKSNGIIQNSNRKAHRLNENDHDMDQNSVEFDVNYRNPDDNDNIADENGHASDDMNYDCVVVDNDAFAVNNHDANLFADADLREIEEMEAANFHPDENMQAYNEGVAENALNEDANAQIFYENNAVQPVFAEPGPLVGYPEPIVQPIFAELIRELPGYPEPRVLPVFAEPGHLPVYPEPGLQPVFAEPEQLQAYPDPEMQPVFAEPGQLPAYPEPRVQPVFAEPDQLPVVEPRDQPAFPDQRQLPNIIQPRQLPVVAGPSNQPVAVEPSSSNTKARKLEVRRVSAQSTVPGEPSVAAQRCVYGDEEMVAIGFHRTLVPRRLMNDINWTTYTTATRQLMQAIFPRRILATHSLSGKPSPASAYHPPRPPKKRLDPKLVEDIVETVRTRCGAHKQWIRGVITTKCTDEARMYRNRQNQYNRDDEDQENQDPEEGPASSERRRRRRSRRQGTEESSSSSE